LTRREKGFGNIAMYNWIFWLYWTWQPKKIIFLSLEGPTVAWYCCNPCFQMTN
jgi:hypothetical protein